MEAVVAWHCSEAATLRLPNFLVIDLMTGVSMGFGEGVAPNHQGRSSPSRASRKVAFFIRVTGVGNLAEERTSR